MSFTGTFSFATFFFSNPTRSVGSSTKYDINHRKHLTWKSLVGQNAGFYKKTLVLFLCGQLLKMCPKSFILLRCDFSDPSSSWSHPGCLIAVAHSSKSQTQRDFVTKSKHFWLCVIWQHCVHLSFPKEHSQWLYGQIAFLWYLASFCKCSDLFIHLFFFSKTGLYILSGGLKAGREK